MQSIHAPRVSGINTDFTGQGFQGEKILAVTAVILTIVSTILLIKVTTLQHKQIKAQMAESDKRKEEEKKKGKT